MNIIEFENKINEFLEMLKLEKKADGTLKIYSIHLYKLIKFFKDNNITNINKENLANFKEFLIKNNKTNTVNLNININNKYLKWLGYSDLKLKTVKVQTNTSLNDIMSKSDYERILRYAKKLNNDKMHFIMRTLACTGIRVDELKYITVETLKAGKTQVTNKGKTRNVILTPILIKELKKYCSNNNISSGIIFHGRDKNRLMDKSYIWKQLQYIAGQARVKKSKIHTLSFRHLFARTYMQTIGDISELADILGHSNIEITRIYTRTSDKEKKANLSKLAL